MKFINKEPRKTFPIPGWAKNLAHDESRMWLMNNAEIYHVKELISVCEFNKLQLIERALGSPFSEFSTEECDELFERIEVQLKDLENHLESIRLKNQKIKDELGDDWLKEKHLKEITLGLSLNKLSA
jgi:hypothetical protein